MKTIFSAAAALMFLPVSLAYADSNLREMAKKDPRLLRKVTVREPQMFVGDLLQEVGRQTGVALSCGSSDGAADERLAVFVDGEPLVNVLDGLWSLVSYQRASFQWHVMGEPPNYSYRFLRPLRARGFPNLLQNLTQGLYEEMVALMVAAAQSQPVERRRIVTRMVKELLDGDEAMINGYMDIEWSWEGIALFARCLSPVQRFQFIGGQLPEQRFAVKDLDADGQRFVQSVWASTKAQRKLGNGESVPVPPPSWISFRNNTNGSGCTAPVLMIDMEEIGGYGYIGGVPLEAMIRKRIAEMWMNEGDQKSSPKQSSELSPIGTVTQDRHSLVMPPLQSRVSRSLSGLRIPFLCRVSDRYNRDPGTPAPNTIAGLLERMKERPPHYQYKWRDGLLLLDYPSWFQDSPLPGTWEVAVQLRNARDKDGGLLTLEELVGAARRLNANQLKKLSDEFPVLNHIARSQDLLVALAPTSARLKQLSSASGIPLDDLTRSVVARNRYLGPALTANDVRAIRVAEIRHHETTPIHNEFVFGFVDRNNRWIPVFGFRDKPATPP